MAFRAVNVDGKSGGAIFCHPKFKTALDRKGS